MAEKTKSTTKLFFSGVLILTLSNLLIKAIGLLLKIPLHALLGDDGMAYYNTAYDVYVWLYMISTQGLPTAVSLLIAESRAKGNLREAQRILRITLWLFVVIGIGGTAVMMAGSKVFAALYKFDEAYLSIIAIAPTLFLICLSSALRGYFQGYQEMLPTAVSQIIEALGKLIIGITLAKWAIGKGCSTAEVAAWTILGLTIGVGAGMLSLVMFKLCFRESDYNAEFVRTDENGNVIAGEVRPVKTLLRLLIVTSIPIMLSSSVMSFTNVIDGIIISRRLQGIGYTEEAARTAFGNYKTLAISMFNLPPVLIYPISYSAIPLLSSAIASGEKERTDRIVRSIIRVAGIIALPCALGMCVLSKPILAMLFSSGESVDMAAPLLSILSPSILFIGLLTMTNAILQAYKRERRPVISLIAGSCVKLLASTILIGVAGIEMKGAPIGTFLCYGSIVLLNFVWMKKDLGISPKVLLVLIRPLCASVVCAGAAWGSWYLLDSLHPGRLATVAAILIAAVVYLFALLLMRGIDREDVLLLPKGRKLLAVMEKLKLM